MCVGEWVRGVLREEGALGVRVCVECVGVLCVYLCLWFDELLFRATVMRIVITSVCGCVECVC